MARLRVGHLRRYLHFVISHGSKLGMCWIAAILAYGDILLHHFPYHQKRPIFDEAVSLAVLLIHVLALILCRTPCRCSNVPLFTPSSTLALGTDVRALVRAGVALGTAIFAGLHVIDETTHIAAEILAWIDCLVVPAHAIENSVNDSAARTAVESSVG
jgi:hypothetical protein